MGVLWGSNVVADEGNFRKRVPTANREYIVHIHGGVRKVSVYHSK